MKDSDLIAKQKLKIVVADAYEMAKFRQTEFIQLRKNGFGAADSSILLGVNPFTTIEELLAQKRSPVPTEEELAVGQLEAVRKGADLEPLILQKFEQWSEQEVYKPDAMYAFTDKDYLTVNFDGVMKLGELYIPVEAKYVSPTGLKHAGSWDLSKAINNLGEGSVKTCGGRSIEEHVKEEATLYGIPVYYFTQLQQQIAALDAPFGYLAALVDKGWQLKVFKVFSDAITQNALYDRALENARKLWLKNSGADA